MNGTTQKKIQRLVAFDYGTQKIGMATGQKITATAEPLPQIKVKDGKPDWLAIEKQLKEWKPDALLVGLPLNMDGTEQEVTQLAQKFSRQLHGRFGLDVFMQDERLTTVGARSELFEKVGFRGLKSRSVDSLAACLILEDWFSHNA
ncbi:MAG: Holliday junction resolvase RuvX [Gammaproteobacteria bacterium CG22_combo_CG10-13_8_21_14_all_40_8]|nr:MAG: Holliday junction resolvase RuvX [Gammaproteobacteria bacterium CG22_combo_CG10-13_8_21_14_all_40_8]